ncbi:sigma-70 family RNA polymerase sigma factor [Empedobacter stercoris]|uniref:RNA polymerase sigma factor n=1 Tax=uncultured Empedobacter sp. TaxID=410844 RepID=UPI001CE17136|nr:sigma-70 family RNA polymerase sigma factor [Empedobacter stercoris]MCA4781678.1 sigma-70 family RNA polymerase sigma factor [Empedobacter stercoris]HJD87260.1 sigma-70 family RNA polymerase sigma factor [Empedobacter falsenii]
MRAKQTYFLELIEQHKGILHKVAKMYMDDADDQNDLMQEIVLQLWKSFERFEGNSQFSTWMYRVSLNTALTYFKKEKKKTDTHTFIENIDRVDEVDSREKETQLELFYKAVHELNKVEKALIFLFLEGQSHKEIGANLGITEGNARVKLNRTKDKLQIIIKKYGYEF